MATALYPPYTSLAYSQILAQTRLPTPLNEHASYIQDTPRYRLNLLATDGDVLYFPYSSSRIARYRIRRSNGVQLEPITTCTITPPIVINNIRIANFATHRGGHLLLMTGGSQASTESGTLTILQLPNSHLDPSCAYTYPLPVTSAWGLAVHNPTGRIAVSSNSQTTLVLAIATHQGFIYHQNRTDSPTAAVPGQTLDEPSAHTQSTPPDTITHDFYRRFRLVPMTRFLNNTHRNNIPCVAFNKSGNLLASASIDTSFALYDMSETCEPFPMVMDLLVPCLSGRRLFQNVIPVPAHDDIYRVRQRNWAVHWLDEHFVCAVNGLTAVRHAWFDQHQDGIWVSESFDENRQSARPDLFLRYGAGAGAGVRRGALAHRPGVSGASLYDDSPNELPDDWKHPHLAEDAEDIHKKKQVRGPESEKSSCFAIASDKYGYPSSQKEAESGWRKRRRKESDCENGRKTSLLLVCLEEAIELYEVAEAIKDHVAAEGVWKRDDVRMIDSLHINSVGLHGREQFIYSNVIEVPKLKAVIVTGICGGVFLIRIVVGGVVPLGDGPEGMIIDGEEPLWRLENGIKPSLFVERIFNTLENVIGTCVVEREAECSLLRSNELWILQQNGTIEAWDLSSTDVAIDPSICL